MPDDGHCEDAGGKFITKKGCFTKLMVKWTSDLDLS